MNECLQMFSCHKNCVVRARRWCVLDVQYYLFYMDESPKLQNVFFCSGHIRHSFFFSLSNNYVMSLFTVGPALFV